MKGIDWIVLAVIVLVIAAVVAFLIRSKRKGVKCIGCPDGHTCSGNCAGCGKD